MTDKKISELVEKNTLLNTDIFTFIREEGGVYTNYKVAKANLAGEIVIDGDDVDLSGYALLDSPTFIGTPSVPNVTAGDSSTLAANTSFVQNIVTPLYTDTISIYINNSVINKTYPVIIKTPYSYQITKLSTYLNAGTCSLNIFKNDNAFLNASTLEVTNTLATYEFLPTLTFDILDDLKVSIVNATEAIDLIITMVIQRT